MVLDVDVSQARLKCGVMCEVPNEIEDLPKYVDNDFVYFATEIYKLEMYQIFS